MYKLPLIWWITIADVWNFPRLFLPSWGHSLWKILAKEEMDMTVAIEKVDDADFLSRCCTNANADELYCNAKEKSHRNFAPAEIRTWKPSRSKWRDHEHDVCHHNISNCCGKSTTTPWEDYWDMIRNANIVGRTRGQETRGFGLDVMMGMQFSLLRFAIVTSSSADRVTSHVWNSHEYVYDSYQVLVKRDTFPRSSRPTTKKRTTMHFMLTQRSSRLPIN
jgi:hypothetical protein